MIKTKIKLVTLVAGTASLLCQGVPQVAYSVGFNSENFTPAIDNQSGIMWETAKSVPYKGLLWGYTFSYALRPVEFGDGKDTREALSDHLQVNTLSLGFGLLPWLDVGASLPIVLYSAPKNPGGVLSEVDSSGRKFFFLGDVHLRAKASLFPGKTEDGFYAAAVVGAKLPTGSTKAMLSDNSVKVTAEIPMHVALDSGNWEIFFTPGAAMWGAKERVVTTDTRTIGENEKILLEKSSALLLNTGARYWLVRRGSSGLGIQLEGGIRGEFSKFKPSLNDQASPIEWSAGGGWYLSQSLSLHGGFGTGIASGAGAPLSRLVAGVRYLETPPPKPVPEEPTQVGLSSDAYSDKELDQIISEAQSENQAPRLGEEETMLKLLNDSQVIDIGAVQFEFNSAKLTPEAKKTVALLDEQLKRLKPKSIKIDGHTDSVGSFKYNLALSKRRSDSVRSELIRLGNKASIITTDGFAFKYPIASNGTKAGRAQNRRIEVALDGQSFRKATYTKEETEMFKRWIAPGGKQPKASD